MVIAMICWLAAATVVERVSGGEAARAMAYGSWSFAALWTVIAVAGMALCVRSGMHRRVAAFAIHISLVLILAGAALTWLTAQNGKVQLMQGVAAHSFVTDKGDEAKLPFSICLKQLEMRHYEGTLTPMGLDADVEFTYNMGNRVKERVSLNHIASHEGYRFCLNGYDPEGKGVSLTVTRDPCGTAVTHCGYVLLLFSMAAYLLSRRTRFRSVMRQLKAAMMAALALAPLTGEAAPRALPQDVAGEMGRLCVLHNGRICPFETMAREVTAKLCGRQSYHGYDACQVVTGWWFYYDDWAAEPMIKVKDRQAREALGTESKQVSFNDFFDAKNAYRLETYLNSSTKGILEANEKCQIAAALGNGSLFKIMPLQDEGTLRWFVPGALDLPADIDEGKWAFAKNGMNYFNELVVREDWAECRRFILKLQRFQQQEAGAALPSKARTRAELLYNRTANPLPCAIVLIMIGILSLSSLAGAPRKAIKLTSAAATLGCWLFVTLLLVLRWIAGGHLPMSNGYETMLLMSWCALSPALFLLRRGGLPAAFGVLAAGFTLLVAHISGSNPAITPLMPVLNSPWLCLHVAVVMMAYALLAVLTLNSLCALVMKRRNDLAERLHLTGQALLYPAVFLLTAGIFIGAVWAGVSWGSYWSWDPKETWALITLLVYAMPLHERSLPRFRKPLFFHAYIVTAFVSVIITYWGVNNLLGGMHSYA